MNAGGVPNTCKSNGHSAMDVSGERVSNALVTCPEAGDNSSKGLLIPHSILEFRNLDLKVKIASGGTCVPSASW